MVHRRFAIEQIAPWLVSGASGCYIMARARRLSRARASQAPWRHFLAQQSDIILVLCGSPAVWHLARRLPARRSARATSDRASISAGVIHQLRQVFTVLLLGLGLIARKAHEGKTAELVSLARRLQHVTRSGARALAALEEPDAPDVILAGPLGCSAQALANGRQA
jgi:hypothetical protein